MLHASHHFPNERRREMASVFQYTVFRLCAESLAEREKELVLRVLEECLWVQKNAAKKLGISPRALNYKVSKMGITHPHWRRNKKVG